MKKYLLNVARQNTLTIIAIVALVIMLLIILAGLAQAVTYRNDGTGPVILKDKNGKQTVLQPGNTIETYYYSNDSNLTKTSDEPYVNPALQRDDVSGGSSASMNLNANFVILRIISGTVSVYAQTTSNTPPIVDGWGDDDTRIQFPYDGTYDTLVVTGPGTVRIEQYKISY